MTVRHAEVLEPDGSLHTVSLRSAKATDIYTLADETDVELRPAFTFHGFRYAEVETTAEVLEAAFVAISSDTPERAHFECSEPRLERLHDNAVWSQRDNFVSVPTDCPQRDERLGWTGDAQAFAPTASTLFDSQSFWASWLRDLALEQDDRAGRAIGRAQCGRGWRPSIRPRWLGGRGDHGAVGGVRVVRRPAIIRDQLDSMRRWVTSLVARAEGGWAAGFERPVRRLARPGRARGPTVGGQDELRLPGQCVLLLERPPGWGRRRAPG